MTPGQKVVGGWESPQVGVLSPKHREVPEAQVCDKANGVREGGREARREGSNHTGVTKKKSKEGAKQEVLGGALVGPELGCCAALG